MTRTTKSRVKQLQSHQACLEKLLSVPDIFCASEMSRLIVLHLSNSLDANNKIKLRSQLHSYVDLLANNSNPVPNYFPQTVHTDLLKQEFQQLCWLSDYAFTYFVASLLL